MELLSFIVVFLIVGFSTVRLRSVLQQRQQTHQSLTTAEPGQETVAPVVQTNRLDSWLNETISKLQGKPAEDPVAPQFRVWAETALGHEAELQAWLLALSSEQMQALVEHVAAYCEQLKVNLTWLTERQIDVPPALKSTVQEIVVGYCIGIWKATQIKAKLDLFTEYQQLTQSTPQQQRQILQRELLAHLAAQKMVAVEPLAATLTGTEAERQAKVVEAIQQAATKDWERFAIIFQTAVSQNGLHPEQHK
jgi:hypothetical protein